MPINRMNGLGNTTYPDPSSSVPPAMPDDAPPKSTEDVYLGSLNHNLRVQIGAYVVVEFLIGTNNLVAKEGILYTVGINYITLYNDVYDYYTVCDFYSIKFVTFYDPRTLRRRTDEEIANLPDDNLSLSRYYTNTLRGEPLSPPSVNPNIKNQYQSGERLFLNRR